jgi:replicative DNA helicase
MELPSNNTLDLKHISSATDEILDYINHRRKGIIRSLRTRWPKFNRQCMGGIEPNVIYSICGISGSGKSSFANSLETDLFDLNTNEKFVVLNFNYEMLASKQVGRKLSYKLKRTTSELYSSSNTDENYKVSDVDFEEILKHADKIKQYPIYYVDSPGSVENMRNTIIAFQSLEEMKNKWLIVILDHTLLTKGKQGESEREIISDLQKMFMERKKHGKITILQLSQMNREIEDKDRINNPNLHYPMRRDIFGSDSLFQTSDYVIVLHRPEILGIVDYGPDKLPVKNRIYMHFLKNREGEPKVLSFENNLKYNRIDEVEPYNTLDL